MMTKTLNLEMTESFQFHFLCLINVQLIKPKWLHNGRNMQLIGLLSKPQNVHFSLWEKIVFLFFCLKTQEMKVSFKK